MTKATKQTHQILDKLFNDDSQPKNRVNSSSQKESKYYTLPELVELTKKNQAWVQLNGKWVQIQLQLIGDKPRIIILL